MASMSFKWLAGTWPVPHAAASTYHGMVADGRVPLERPITWLDHEFHGQLCDMRRQQQRKQLAEEDGNPHVHDAASRHKRASIFSRWLLDTFGR